MPGANGLRFCAMSPVAVLALMLIESSVIWMNLHYASSTDAVREFRKAR